MAVDQKLCLSCARPVKETDTICPWCAKPIISVATTQSVSPIGAQEETILGNFQRPTPLIVLGSCLAFGPPFIVILLAILYFLLDFGGRVTDRLIGLIASLFFAWMYFTIMRTVIRRYRASRKEAAEGLADEEE